MVKWLHSDAPMRGKLYLCATPIGNLEDMTFRVIQTLKEVDLIAAEDTRHTIKLLNHFDIKTPMTSYHEFNKIEKGHELVRQLLEGKNIALVSDAGTPGISDPGEELVKFCYDAGIEVTSLPGPAACITALTMSGLPTRRFCFEGFLPTDKKEQEIVLNRLKTETRTTIFYEAPHRLAKTLTLFENYIPQRRLTVCKELTKRYESAAQMSVAEASSYFREHEAKGEYVLVIEGISQKVLDDAQKESWEKIPIEAHMRQYEQQGIPRKEAMKAVAADRGMSKREVYQYLLEHKE